MKLMEVLIDEYQHNPPKAILTAYDDFMAANKGVPINDEALSDYGNALEENAFAAGFAAALELMQEAAAARR